MRVLSPAGVLAALLMLAPAVLGAQQLSHSRAGLSASGRERAPRDMLTLDLPRQRKSYWKEGGLLTSLITIVAANIWVRDVSARQRVLGSVALGAVFFVPGALIGGQFPKD